MNRRIWLLVCSLVVMTIVFGLVAGCAQSTPAPTAAPKPTTTAPAPAVTRWVLQNVYVGTKWGESGGWAYYFADKMKTLSGGRLLIDIKPPEAVVPTTEVFSAVGKGTIDMSGLYYAGYHTGLMPEADVQVGPPFSWSTSMEGVQCYEDYGFKDKFLQIYAEHNIYHCYTFVDNLYILHTAFPVSSPDDMKGKKIRAPGIYGKWVESFGGSPVNIPHAEVYMGVKLGTIDGSIMSPDTLLAAKLEEVFKYAVVVPNLTTLAASFIYNMDSLKKLPADLQDLVKETTTPLAHQFAKSVGMYNIYAIKHAAKTYGMQEVTWTGAAVDKAVANGIATWDTIAAKSPRCKELVDTLKKQMKDLGKMK